MTDTSYNGWANYPTWAVSMWLDGNYDGPGTYHDVCELVEERLADGGERWAVAYVDWYELADAWIDTLAEEGVPS